MLRLEGVTFRYAGATGPSLVGVSLELADSEVVGVVGASEAGKSTLCLVAGGLAPRTVRGALDGRLLIDGRDMAGRPMHELAALVGSGFQRPAAQLTGMHDTVYEEVAFGPANLGVSRDELVVRVEEALELLRIQDLADRDPVRLSGGQQQLVAIAGLLAMRPRHLVLDEPTAQLDPLGTRLVMDAIADLAVAGMTILVAEHKVDELARICGRVVALDRGQVARDGPAAEVLADARLRGMGIAELAPVRLRRLVAEAGLAPSRIPDMA